MEGEQKRLEELPDYDVSLRLSKGHGKEDGVEWL